MSVSIKSNKGHPALSAILPVVILVPLIISQVSADQPVQQHKTTNITDPVIITFEINPMDAGDIFCDGKKMIPNNREDYEFASKLNCQVRTKYTSEFTSWSGLVSTSENPIVFRALEDGKLVANLKKPFIIPSDFFVIVAVALLLFVVFNLRILISKYRRRSTYLHKSNQIINASVVNSSNNTGESLQLLQTIRNEVMNLFKQGRITEEQYELLTNRIARNIEKIESDKEKKELHPNALLNAVKELTSAYSSVLQLLYIDIASVLTRTATNSSKNTKFSRVLKSERLTTAFYKYSGKTPIERHSFFTWNAWSSRKLFDAGKGGFFAVFLFRRRIRKVFDSILSTCNFLLQYEKEPETVTTIRNVIDHITCSQKSLLGSEKEARSKQIDLVFRIIPIILTVITPPIITTYFAPLATVSFFSFENLLYLFYIIYFILLFFIIRIHRGIKWYKKIIRITRVQDKESDVYDCLIPMQRLVISRAFPSILGVLDESENKL